jgi:transcriptional regulator with XRE-family HTH domain
MLTPAQLRAARALLGWSRADLAAKSGVHAESIKGFELRGTDPKQSTIMKWARALRDAGVEIFDEDDRGGPGVRLRSGKQEARKRR